MNRVSYKRELVVAVGFVVLNLVILFLGGWFLTSKIISSSAQLTEEKGVLEVTQKNWEQITRSQKETQSIKSELAKIDEAFVSKNEPIEFIDLLENLAQKTNNLFGIELMTLGADPKKSENALLFQIRLTGNFSNLMHFLNYLENMKYQAQVQTLNISRVGASASQTSGGQQIPSDSVYSIINLKTFTQ